MGVRQMDLLGLRAIARQRAAFTVLLMLLAVDVLYFAAHLRAARQPEVATLSYVDMEYGYPEAFQTLQWLWAIGLVLLLGVAAARWAFLGLLPLLAFFLATDRYSLHERGGAALADALGLGGVLGLRAVDIGELIVVAAAAAVVIPCALVGLRLASRPDRPEISRALVLCALIALAGVVLDMVHIVVIDEPKTGDAFGLLEDGGEMLAATLLVAHLFRVWIDRPPHPLVARALGRPREAAQHDDP